MGENNAFKSNCLNKGVQVVSHGMIAEAVGCSPNTVKAVRNGQRNKDTDLGQRIEVAELLLVEGQNKLIQEVKRVVQFS